MQVYEIMVHFKIYYHRLDGHFKLYEIQNIYACVCEALIIFRRIYRGSFLLLFCIQRRSPSYRNESKSLFHSLKEHKYIGSGTNNAPFLLQNPLLQNHKHVIR